jgi:hypothetical protein
VGGVELLEPGEFGQKHVFRADVGPVRSFPSPIPLAYIVKLILGRPDKDNKTE